MKGKAKSRIALVLAAALGLGAVGALSSMAWLTERTTNFDPDPSGVAAIGAEDEAAGENDGSGGVDWGYWQSVNPDIIGWVTVPGTGIDTRSSRPMRATPTTTPPLRRVRRLELPRRALPALEVRG